MPKAVEFLTQKKMKTTTRGLLTEMQVQVALLSMDARLLMPVGTDHPYDLAVEHKNRFCRIQIKTARATLWKGVDNGGLRIAGCSVVDRVGGKFQKILTAADCDVILGLDPLTNRIYRVFPTGLNYYTIRLTPCRQKQKIRIRNAADYEFKCLDDLFPA